MRILMLVAAAAALSGCLSVSSTEDSEPSSLSCIGDECRVCAAGDCAPCPDQESCQECMDGDCPQLEQARLAGPAPPPADVDIQESHDLRLGLEATTWTFEVAPGAVGQVHFVVQDLVLGQYALNTEVCIEYTIWGPGTDSQGSQGTCNNTGVAVVAAGTTTDHPHPILAWEDLVAGSYEIVATAKPQPNELIVDIQVDNP